MVVPSAPTHAGDRTPQCVLWILRLVVRAGIGSRALRDGDVRRSLFLPDPDDDAKLDSRSLREVLKRQLEDGEAAGIAQDGPLPRNVATIGRVCRLSAIECAIIELVATMEIDAGLRECFLSPHSATPRDLARLLGVALDVPKSEIAAALRPQLPGASVAARGTVVVRPSGCPSRLAEALATRLGAEHGMSSDVHWGNDGFCVDVALHHPTRPEDVTVGILCDGARYDKAEDPVEWDLFRTAILQQQGWDFVRLWALHFFRDPATAIANVQKAAEAVAAREPPPASVPMPVATRSQDLN